jgi:hypothetical protein
MESDKQTHNFKPNSSFENALTWILHTPICFRQLRRRVEGGGQLRLQPLTNLMRKGA